MHSVQVRFSGDDEHFSVAGRAEAVNRLKHSLTNKSTAEKAGRTWKDLDATDTVWVKKTDQETDQYVQLSEMKTKSKHALLDTQKKTDTWKAEVAGATVINAMKISAVEAQDRSVHFTLSLAVRVVIGIILEERVLADYKQNAMMGAVVHPSIFEAFSNVFLKNVDLMALIATVVSNYVEKRSNCVKK